MGLFRNKTNKGMNFLEMTPRRVHQHELTANDGLVNVLVPKFSGKVLGRFIQPRLRDKYIKANLDRFGTSVWLKLEDDKNVRQIADALTAEFGDSIQPVNQRLTKFLQQLYNAGFITFKEIERN
jgi:hypothetical protein